MSLNARQEPILIGLDWGTTSLRCYLMSGDGTVLEQKATQQGIMSVVSGDYETVLTESVGSWMERHPQCVVVASGMVTSRQGWVEIPYTECPVAGVDLATSLYRHRTDNGTEINFVPGVNVTGSDGVPDVMRGEETQILGALTPGDTDRVFVLPGTHSKWARTVGPRIVWFATFMTGEVYSVMRRHSILGRLIETDEESAAWFDRGVDYGLSADADTGGLLKKLFGTRALRLFDAVPAAGAASHLSGLLIGTEIRDAITCIRGQTVVENVTILAESGLAALYGRAVTRAGLGVVEGPDLAAARGHHMIAVSAGLIGNEE